VSLVESAAGKLRDVDPSLVGTIGAVLSESSQRAAFEFTSVRGVAYVAKAHLSRESTTGS